MNQLYNSVGQRGLNSSITRKLGLLASLLLILTSVISCRRAPSVAEEASPVRTATEAIAEAEQFYQGRSDLVKVRQGLVTLRQAQASDQGNYELAWRLA